MISSKEGQSKWWLVPPTTFDLCLVGCFRHHWNNTITSFDEHRCIDFDEPAGFYQGTEVIRIELTAHGDRETAFLFLSTWGASVQSPEPKPGEPKKLVRQF
jgi:hypothetical protein